MPISFRFDQERQRLHTTVTGRIAAAEILAHFHALRQARLLSCTEIIDARGVTPPCLSTEELWLVAGSIQEFKAGSGYAARAVVVKGDLFFGLARVFASLMEAQVPMRVFREPAEAEQWLAGQPGIGM
jgi:hypothetical protein